MASPSSMGKVSCISGSRPAGHFVSFIEQAAVRSVVRQQILDNLTEAPSGSG